MQDTGTSEEHLPILFGNESGGMESAGMTFLLSSGKSPQRGFLPALADHKGMKLIEKATETETTGVCFCKYCPDSGDDTGTCPLVMINHSAEQN